MCLICIPTVSEITRNTPSAKANNQVSSIARNSRRGLTMFYGSDSQSVILFRISARGCLTLIANSSRNFIDASAGNNMPFSIIWSKR